MESSGSAPPVWVDAPDLRTAVGSPGPYVTVVLATEAAIDNAGHRNTLRWQGMRQELLDQGAPEALLGQIDELVPEAHHDGQTLVVLADGAGVRHVSHWDELPHREVGRWAPLPRLGEVLSRRQAHPARLHVIADRTGADLIGVRYDAPPLEEDVAGSTRPIRKVQPGGWSQRRFQERAEHTWEQNARQVAERVAAMLGRMNARLVLTAGDARALQLLRESLPVEVTPLVREVSGSRAADGSPLVGADVERHLAEAEARDTEALLAKLDEELGQSDRACDGAARTLAALVGGRVQALLVHDDPDDERTAWFGDDPAVVGHTRDDVASLGVDSPREGRLVDVALRAALATSSGVRFLPEPGRIRQDIAAILRWS
jgi:hypothetical protein